MKYMLKSIQAVHVRVLSNITFAYSHIQSSVEEAGWRTAATCLDAAWASCGEKYDTSLPQTAYVSYFYPT